MSFTDITKPATPTFTNIARFDSEGGALLWAVESALLWKAGSELLWAEGSTLYTNRNKPTAPSYISINKPS